MPFVFWVISATLYAFAVLRHLHGATADRTDKMLADQFFVIVQGFSFSESKYRLWRALGGWGFGSVLPYIVIQNAEKINRFGENRYGFPPKQLFSR